MAIQAVSIPVSLIKNESISLPLEHGPFHIFVRIPFSLLVRDFDPRTTPVPEHTRMERPRPWWATCLPFGRRQTKTPLSAAIKAARVAHLAYCFEVWPKLSALLFGMRKSRLQTLCGSDAKDWERAGASNLFWAFATGVTDDDVERARAIVVKADQDADADGPILFTVEEMGEEEKAGWKAVWMDTAVPNRLPGETDVDCAMMRKNLALYSYMTGSASRSFSNEKESLEKVSS